VNDSGGSVGDLAGVDPHTRYLDGVARISKVILASNDIDQMLSDVLDAMLPILECDRAWLLFPCDPDAPTWSVPMERTRPEWPGAGATKAQLPMNDFASGVMRMALGSDRPVSMREGEPGFASEVHKQFSIRAQLLIALYPRTGRPWLLGIHHCGEAHVYTANERALFAAIADRLADGLSTLLLHRHLDLEAQLQHSQRLEAVGQLTGGVAHDFNNLLTAIMGTLEIARLCLDRPEKAKQHIQHALDSSQRAATLTQRLLAFSRKQSLEPEIVDLHRLVQGMENLLGRTLGEGVAVSTTCGEIPWPVSIDRAQMENAVLNLAINARDAMDGGGALEIETSNQKLAGDDARAVGVAPGRYVRLTVRDSGTGMSADVLSKVFEPFFSTKEVGRGSGLGLSMVYGFANQSGGTVTIDSEEGVGTTVHMWLPRSGDARTGDEQRSDAVEPKGAGEVILVVEDDPAVRDTAVSLLRSLGYQTLAAHNGAVALAAMDASDVDLVLTDVVLPGDVNGKDVLLEARRRVPGLPALLTSGYAEDVIAKHGGTEPGVGVLTKPYTRLELATRVREMLDSAA